MYPNASQSDKKIKMNDLLYTRMNKRPYHPHKADNKSVLEMHLRCIKEPSPLYELARFTTYFVIKKQRMGWFNTTGIDQRLLKRVYSSHQLNPECISVKCKSGDSELLV